MGRRISCDEAFQSACELLNTNMSEKLKCGSLLHVDRRIRKMHLTSFKWGVLNCSSDGIIISDSLLQLAPRLDAARRDGFSTVSLRL